MALTITYGTASLINSGATSGTVTAPTVAIGDRMLLVVAFGGGNPVLGAGGITGGGAGSWTEVTGFPVGGGITATGLTVATKVAASGDSGAVFTVNYNATQKAIMWIIRLNDSAGTTSLGASSGKYSSTAATALTSNQITIAAGSQVLAMFTQRDSSVATTYTAGAFTGTAAGLTATERDDQSNTGSSEVAAELQDGNAVASGAGTVTAAATATQNLAYCAGIIELIPAAAAPAGQLPQRETQRRWARPALASCGTAYR